MNAMVELTSKPCNCCNEIKPLSAFSPHKGGLLGRYPKCKECRRLAKIKERAAMRVAAGLPAQPRNYQGRPMNADGSFALAACCKHDPAAISLNDTLFAYLRACVRPGDNANAPWAIP